MSVNKGVTMHQAGFDVVYVSDHPALNGQYLREAATAHSAGLDRWDRAGRGRDSEVDSTAWKNAKVRGPPAQRGLSTSTSSEDHFRAARCQWSIPSDWRGGEIGAVVVRDGRIECVGSCQIPRDVDFTLNLTDGHLMPVGLAA